MRFAEKRTPSPHPKCSALLPVLALASHGSSFVGKSDRLEKKTRESLRKHANLCQSTAALLAVAILLFSAVTRAAESESDHLAQILELKPGSSVADVGAGSGELSIAIAKRVEPYGKVYSTEINPTLLDKIRNSAQKARAQDVIIVVVGKEHDSGLPTGCCDAIFLRDVYHHLTDPVGIDRSLYQALRPGARLAIIDFEPIPGWPAPSGVPANRRWHGVTEQIAAQELTRIGFELVTTIDWPISAAIKHYCMLFRKPFPRSAINNIPTAHHQNQETSTSNPT
jgi:SAM-dependent methyltransferase